MWQNMETLIKAFKPLPWWSPVLDVNVLVIATYEINLSQILMLLEIQIFSFFKSALSSHAHIMAETQWPQIAKIMGLTWDPPGSCRPQMGPMLAPWTLLSGAVCS